MLDKFVIVIRKVSGAIKITVLLVIVRILLGEVIKLLLSLFYGQYGGSFLLFSLTLGSLGVSIILLMILNFFKVYIVPVTISVFYLNALHDGQRKKRLIAIGLLAGIAAITTEWFIFIDSPTFETASRWSLINDVVSSLAITLASTYLFQRYAILKNNQTT